MFISLLHFFVDLRSLFLSSHCSDSIIKDLLFLHLKIIVFTHEFTRIINEVIGLFLQFASVTFLSLFFISFLLCLRVVVNVKFQVIFALLPWPMLGTW